MILLIVLYLYSKLFSYMRNFYYLLEEISVDIPKTYLQYLEFWRIFIIIAITAIIFLFIKKLIKPKNIFIKLTLILTLISVTSLIGDITLQTVQYYHKKSNFENSKASSDYLRKIVIYQALKNHAHTLSESDLFKTNEPQIVENLREKEYYLENEHRRNFNLVKNTLLNVQKNPLDRIAYIIERPDVCTKDAINDLYRCRLVLENPYGITIYAHTLIYTNPKYYQDYLLYGLKKTTN